MKIRLIQLMNNYYKDRTGIDQAMEQPLGEFCCFGYFDAMSSSCVRFDSVKSGEGIKETVDKIIVEKTDGKSSCRTLICLTDKDNQDELYWENQKKMPYLIVSIVRLNEQERRQEEQLKAMINTVQQKEYVMAYYTYEQADLVIVKAARSYGEAIEFAGALRREEPIYKMYSIFAVQESVLKACKEDEDYAGIENETIKCILRCSVKKMNAVDDFLKELKNALEKQGICVESCLKKFHILGNNDIMIEMENMPVRELLPLYLTGGILTHTSKFYQEAFFNIESEFLKAE